MQRDHQVSLRPYNTFALDAVAEELIILETISDLEPVFQSRTDRFVIGGGSNILLKDPVYESVVVNRLKGINIIDTDENFVTISVGSGENWHEFVLWALSQNYGGIENLSLIPGTVGAAPIQNIGAYGVELKDVLIGVDFYHYQDHQVHFIPVMDCQLGYRDSVFKNELKNQGLTVNVYLRLTRKDHVINTAYAALSQYVDRMGWTSPSIDQVSQAVISIRQSKLPDWRKLGNAGSFFKNPVIALSDYRELQVDYPEIPSYPIDETNIKVPAAWLIQQAGFKGKKWGRVGCYELQSLVLVNYGGATGAELIELSDMIQESVNEMFGIELVPEVTII